MTHGSWFSTFTEITVIVLKPSTIWTDWRAARVASMLGSLVADQPVQDVLTYTVSSALDRACLSSAAGAVKWGTNCVGGGNGWW